MVKSKDKILYFFGIESNTLTEEDRKELEASERYLKRIFLSLLVFLFLYASGNYFVLSKYTDENIRFLAVVQEEKPILEKILLDETSTLQEKEFALTALDFKEYMHDIVRLSKAKNLNEYLGKLRTRNLLGNIFSNYSNYKDMKRETNEFIELIEKNK